ncbi:MAG: hypothetical protein KAR16_14170 [Bacteroidales bacterium]|nr:hypothetical protein [Bacteroidales bacterium]
MKKITIKLLSIFAIALLLNGCSEAEQILYQGDPFASFTNGTTGDYPVQDGNAPFLVQVGIPAPLGNDLTISLSEVYASGTAGTHYDLPNSVTIPAGSVTADISVVGHFDNMAGRIDTLVFALTGDVVANFNNEYTLYLKQYCPSDPAVIVGTYTSVTTSSFPDFTDPVVDLEHTIIITATEVEGIYTVSDFSFGTYNYFYAAVGWAPPGDWPGTIKDDCGEFYFIDTADPWGEIVYGDFTFNVDGTITVVGGTSYGETWTAVMTKQ